MKKDFFTLVALFVLSIGSSFAFYQCKRTPAGNSSNTSPYGTQGANQVWIQNMAFTPNTSTVAINTTVKWTNNDAAEHRVVSTTDLFDSGRLKKGESFNHEFTTSGTYTYKCSLHPSMTGTVTVK